MLGRPRRVALLAEGCFAPLGAKTAVGVLRYRPQEVAAVIDSTRAGRTAEDCIGAGGSVPVVADLAAAAVCGADSLLLGIAPQGGALPEAWRAAVRESLARGWDVLAGLHVFLGDDPELAALAAEHGARIVDVRRPPARRVVAAGRAAGVEATVVQTVGTDCNVGKMTATLELERELARRGVRAGFVATGQTGIFIADHGAAVDAIPADFVAGETEALVLEAARGAEVVLVEGQGALQHPAYSGVTLALLHGAAPAAMVLCHHAGRTHVRRPGGIERGREIPPLAAMRSAYETAASWLRPAPVIGVALNTMDLDEAAARGACADAARSTGLPATDPVRFGAAPLADAVLALHAARRAGGAREVR
jgi:uncharacterized NAD-dependent epimerase/dehydratase family protein